MPEKQDLKNHRQVAVACKNYTDKEIKASEERILSIVARNNVDFIDHINEPTYRFTAPLNSKLLMLQSIAGNSNKIAPSTPSDDSVARLKVIPDNTYKSQIDYIGGKTVKYNQLMSVFSETYTQNNTTITINDGAWVVSGTTSGGDFNYVRWISGYNTSHKYLLYFKGFTGTSSTKFIQTFSTMLTNEGIIFTPNATGGNIQFYVYDGNNASGTYYPIIVDLTDKFGAGNEPSTVEEAIPLLKSNGYKLDGTDTYSTGDLKHAIVRGVKYSGTNLFNSTIEDFEQGEILGSAKKVEYTLKPNTRYTLSCIDTTGSSSGANVWFNGISSADAGVFFNRPVTTTTDSNGKLFIAIRENKITEAINTYQLMLNEGNTTLPYEPYVSQLLPIPSEVLVDTRYGIGFDNTNYNHLDSDGHLRGSWGIVDLGSLNWGRQTDGASPYFRASLTDVASSTLNVLCAKFDTVAWSSLYNSTTEKCCGIYYSQYILVRDNSYETAEAFKTAMSGVYLVYELATSFDQDYSQYFDTNWNKVDLDNQYDTCEMVVDEPIDMPNKVEYYGTIIHSLATAVKKEGFNVWDEEWELGTFDNNGQPASNTSARRTKNYINVISSTNYYFYWKSYEASSSIALLQYDTNNTLISEPEYFYVNSKSFTTASNCKYIKFRIYNQNWSQSSNPTLDICINISGTLNGTYKPYKAPITRLLPNSEAKYSWGITDGVRNTRVFCDDECNPVNKGQLDVDNQDLGIPNWLISNNLFATNLNTLRGYPFISAMYQFAGDINIGNVQNMEGITRDGDIYLRNDSYSTPEAFKTAMNGEPLWYQKNTTDTETLDDFDFSFDCEEGDTFTIIGCELLQCYATYSFLIKEAKSNE